MKITFEMDIRLMPSPRPRVTRSGTFMPQKYTDQKKLIQAKIRGFKSFGRSSIALRLTIGLKRAKKGSNKNLYAMPTGDNDNYAKTVMDACEGILFENDRQIVELYVKKGYFSENFIRADFEKVQQD